MICSSILRPRRLVTAGGRSASEKYLEELEANLRDVSGRSVFASNAARFRPLIPWAESLRRHLSPDSVENSFISDWNTLRNRVRPRFRRHCPTNRQRDIQRIMMGANSEIEESGGGRSASENFREAQEAFDYLVRCTCGIDLGQNIELKVCLSRGSFLAATVC